MTPRMAATACALSALAGYVDGMGFVHLGGLFVSFMSGNSTRFGVMLIERHWIDAAIAAGLIALFVAGAAAGTLIVSRPTGYRQGWLLLVEAVLLIGAAGLAEAGLLDAAIAAIVLAMGLENAVFQAGGGGGVGLTYVTGALVKVGQGFALALTGGARWSWLPNLALWAALVAGAALGAFAYQAVALRAIWPAAATALLLAALFAVLHRRSPVEKTA